MSGSHERIPQWRRWLPWGLGIFAAWAFCGAFGLTIMPWVKFPDSRFVLEQVGWRLLGWAGAWFLLLGILFSLRLLLKRWWTAPVTLVVAMASFGMFLASVVGFAMDVVQMKLPGYRGHVFMPAHQVTLLSYGPHMPLVSELTEIINGYETSDLQMGEALDALGPETLLSETTLMNPQAIAEKRQRVLTLSQTLKGDRARIMGMLAQWENKLNHPATDQEQVHTLSQKIASPYHCLKRSIHEYFRMMDVFFSQTLLVYDTMASLPTGEVTLEGGGLMFKTEDALQRFKTQMGAFSEISKQLSKTSQESRGALLTLRKSIEDLGEPVVTGAGS